MRRILLNSKYYDIVGEIIQRAISPWTAKIATGSREYEDFSQASLKEWHDFRSGIGLESALPDQSARLWWLEGVDVGTPRGAVLNPLVNTAGTFGATPIKIFDFGGNTYALSASAIKKWNTGTSAWDSQGALVEDCEDAWNESSHANITSSQDTSDKKVGSASAKLTVVNSAIGGPQVLATEQISSADYSNYKAITFWIKCSADQAAGELELLLDDSANCASPVESIALPALTANTWTLVSVALANPASDTAIVSVGLGTGSSGSLSVGTTINIDQIVTGGYIVGFLDNPIDAIEVTDGTDTYLVITSAARALYYSSTAGWKYLDGPRDYLAVFDNRLISLDSDGVTVRYSPVGNIDGTWATFTLTENMGTVYGLYSGKLLSTGEPCLFVHATRGWFTIDFYTQKVYKQELQYPPTTYAGHCGMYFNANHYIGTGAGIMKVAANMATPIGPDLDDGLPSGYQGDIYDMIGVNNWIVYCVNGGSSDRSSILKRRTDLGGNLQIYTTSAVNKPIPCIHHSPSSMYTNGRLWWGEGTSIKYCMFPDTSPNPKQISTYQYVSASAAQGLILPKFRELAAIQKLALGVATITKDCDANEYITLYYDINNSGTWTSLGTYKSSPRPTLLEFNSGLGTAFYIIQFAVKLQRGGTNTNSPELESLMFYYLPRVVCINAWTFNIHALEENAETIIAELEGVRDTTALVVFNPTGDADKTSFNHNVALTTMPLKFHCENEKTREGWVEVEVAEIFKG